MKLAELRRCTSRSSTVSRSTSPQTADFFPARPTADNWQTSAWMPRTPGIRELPQLEPDGEHFQ